MANQRLNKYDSRGMLSVIQGFKVVALAVIAFVLFELSLVVVKPLVAVPAGFVDTNVVVALRVSTGYSVGR